MKEQLGSRLGLPHVHDVLKQVCERMISVEEACESLGVAKSRLYELRSRYLEVRAAGEINAWRPGVSGGNHAAPWDERVRAARTANPSPSTPGGPARTGRPAASRRRTAYAERGTESGT